MRVKTIDIALIGTLSSLAICLNMIEAVVLPQLIPGMKIGIANLVTVLSVFLLNRNHVLYIVIIRVIVSSILLGTFFSIHFFFSTSGALISTLITLLLYYFDKNVSPVFLCISGAIAHNVAQLIVAYLLIGYGFIYYLPYLILFALPTGYITGIIVDRLLKYKFKTIYTI